MESIIIYYKEKSDDFLQAISWLKEHNFSIQLKKIDTITQREIFQLIYLSGLDIPDILKKTSNYSLFTKKKKDKMRNLRFAESLVFLEQHPELLQDPIILSNKYSLLGFNAKKIKYFLL